MKNKISCCAIKLVAILLTSGLYPGMVLSQNFERAYGSSFEDEAQCIIDAFDGGYLMAGYTYDTTNQNEILLVKTDQAGNEVWSETIGTPNDEQAFWLERGTDSTYLLCGNSFDNINNKLFDFVIRINISGAILLQKLYFVNYGERASCIRETKDGGFVVAGETTVGGVDLQLNLFKTDSSGNVLWSKAFGDTEQESATCVTQTGDNGFIVSGVARYGLSWSSIFIIKTDSSGNLQWANKYNTQPYFSRCDVSRILETTNGGYLVSGATSGNQPLKSIFLMELDSTGSIVWQSLYGTGQGERNNDIIHEENGYVLCGSTATTTGYDNLLLMKTDDAGNLMWQLSYGVQDSNTVANGLVKSGDGKYMIAGYTDVYGAGATDVFLVKSDSVFDGSLCDMKVPPMIQDTITLVATPINISSTVNTVGQNVSFSVSAGVTGTPVCIQAVNVNANESPAIFKIVPNPFSKATTIFFSTPEAEDAAGLVIYDSFGRKVKSMTDNIISREHQFIFSSEECDLNLSNGIYYFIFSAGNYTSSGKMVFEN